jgi:flagellin FlaB
MKSRVTSALRKEEGITGLETAIILIAFVVVATVFAFVVLTTGIFSAERGKETVYAGLAKARGTMEVRGGIVVQDSDTTIASTITAGTIQFSVSTTAGGEPIPLDPAATNNRTVIAFRDDNVVDNDVEYTADDIIGNGNTLLEPGEVKLIKIDFDGTTNNSDLSGEIGNNSRWTLEVQTPVGAVLDITRSMPAEMTAVMQLH